MSGSDVDAVVTAARIAQERRRGVEFVPLQRKPRRGRGGRTARATVAVVAGGVIVTVAMLLGVGAFGMVAAAMMVLAVTMLAIFAPATPVPTPERIAKAELKALPAQTARWLEAQRPALPAPAVPILTRLDRQLDTLGVQLAALDEDSPVALEIRRLVGEQLPAFVGDYARVPPAMRATPRNGMTPDQQLLDGLGVIEREIGEVSARLAQGDLDALETKRRFLEVKYEGE